MGQVGQANMQRRLSSLHWWLGGKFYVSKTHPNLTGGQDGKVNGWGCYPPVNLWKATWTLRRKCVCGKILVANNHRFMSKAYII